MNARTIHHAAPAMVLALAACGGQGTAFHFPLIMQQDQPVRITRPAQQGATTQEECVLIEAGTVEPAVALFWTNEATGETGLASPEENPLLWSALVPLTPGPNPIRIDLLSAEGTGRSALVVVVFEA